MSTKKDAYDVKAGERFSYQGRTYRAVKDARGEFRPHIEVEDHKGGDPYEILLPHGAHVTLRFDFAIGQQVWWSFVPEVPWEVFKVEELVLGLRRAWGDGRFEQHFVNPDECRPVE